MTKPTSIGVIGGSFDPIHLGHCDLFGKILEQYKFDRLYIVPANQNPLKSETRTSPSLRLKMVLAATQGFGKELQVLDWEALAEPPSYTVTTLERLMHQNLNITWIMGDEVFQEFPRWHRPTRILEIADLIIATRSQSSIDVKRVLKELGAQVSQKSDSKFIASGVDFETQIEVFPLDALPYSSTLLRSTISKLWNSNELTHPPTGLAPEVWKVIKENRLYAEPSFAE